MTDEMQSALQQAEYRALNLAIQACRNAIEARDASQHAGFNLPATSTTEADLLDEIANWEGV